VVVENFRPDVMEGLGLGPEALRTLNPRLVYCNISGFGRDGPYRRRPAYDQIAQGMAGLMSVTGEPGPEEKDMARMPVYGFVVAGIVAAVLSGGPAATEEQCGAIYPHIKDSQLKVEMVPQNAERAQARIRNTDTSTTARNTTVLVTFWNAANQPLESTCVRLGDVRPGQEVDFEVAIPAGTARLSAGAQSTWGQ
jgi:hypothetical protein